MSDLWELISGATRNDYVLRDLLYRFIGLGGYTAAVFVFGYLTARARWAALLEAANGSSDAVKDAADFPVECDHLLMEIRQELDAHSDTAHQLNEQLNSSDHELIRGHAKAAREENQQFQEFLSDRCSQLERHSGNRGGTLKKFLQLLAGHRRRATELDGVLARFEDCEQLESAISPLRKCIQELQNDNRRLQAELDETRKAVALQSQKLEQAQAEARIDALTGLPNRRSFDERIDQFHALYDRGNSPYVVALLDIDHFKSINDEHGHGVGDKVLAFVADVLRSTQRWTDHVARFGGEEFVILLPRLNGHKAKFVVDRQRALIENATLALGGQKLSVTVSAGIAEVFPGDTIAAVLARADEALYAAKASGRNQTCLEDNGKIVHFNEFHSLEEASLV